MSALQNAFLAFEQLAKKRCAERGESWDAFQAKIAARIEAEEKAAKDNADYHTRMLAHAAKVMFTPKSNVSDEEWAERAYEFRCENPPHERERSDLEEHGHFTRTI